MLCEHHRARRRYPISQVVLDGLGRAFPPASIGHAYASTEADVGFAVDDGREGFPADLIGWNRDGVEMKVVDGSVRIRSHRTARAPISAPMRRRSPMPRASSTPAIWSSCAASATISSASAATSSTSAG